MRSSLMIAVLGVAAVLGCQRRSAPEVSKTEVTSAEIVGEPIYIDLDTAAYEQFYETAKADLSNLERRIERLEERADGAPNGAAAKRELAQARQRMEALHNEVETMGPQSIDDKGREGLDRRWDEVSLLVESVGELLTDAPRTTAPAAPAAAVAADAE